jgi:hypothetical protein
MALSGSFLAMASSTDPMIVYTKDGTTWTQVSTNHGATSRMWFDGTYFIYADAFQYFSYTKTFDEGWTDGYKGTAAAPTAVATNGTGRTLFLDTSVSPRVFILDTNNIRSASTINKTIVPAKPKLGSHSTSVTVTGLSSFTNTDHVEAWIMGSDNTSSHNQIEHQLTPIKFKITNPISGVGFTINATSEYRLTGDFKIRYVYAS